MPEKAVMISIRPEWCSLIAQGKKTVEVRKTQPKLAMPFKCYIYCTLSGCNDFFRDVLDGDVAAWNRSKMADMKGKVIGEFVCDDVFEINKPYGMYNRGTCMLPVDMFRYAQGMQLYGWHISDLVIYDKPRRLDEFSVTDNAAVQRCFNRHLAGQPEYVTKHDGWLKGSFVCYKNGEPDWCTKCKTKPLQRPPQSWCYVTEV